MAPTEGTTMSVGLFFAVISAIFNGSFAALFKTRRMVQLSIHPMVFQLYVCGGIFLSSWVLAWSFLNENPQTTMIEDFVSLIPMGFLAGGLFVVAVSASFLAIDEIGLALAQGIWGGSAMLVSYLWGVVGFDQIPSHLSLSLFGLLLLIVGVLVIAFCESLGSTVLFFVEPERRSINANRGGDEYSEINETSEPLLTSARTAPSPSGAASREEQDTGSRAEAAEIDARTMEGDRNENSSQYQHTGMEVDAVTVGASNTTSHVEQQIGLGRDVATVFNSQSTARGVIWAGVVGLSGGSILAPLHYVPAEKQGLIFLPSFGTGALLVSPIVFFLYQVVVMGSSSSSPPIRFHAKEALGTGLLSGAIWNSGNLLSIFAIPAIGYGVAYPIQQCAILVSGVWGIFIFREITERRAIGTFWVGGALLVAGGAILAWAQQ